MEKLPSTTTLSVILPHFEEIPHVFVGSRAIGASRPDSDWDFAFSKSYKDRVNAAVDFYGCHSGVYELVRSHSNDSLKFKVDVAPHLKPLISSSHLSINFLFLDPKDLEAWDRATKAMKVFVDAKIVLPLTKGKRVEIFEDIVVACGGSRPVLKGYS